MAECIPHELLIEILTRLPVKSLLRFKIVCKFWYSLITNPSFIAAHLNQNQKKNTRTFLFKYFDSVKREEIYTFCRADETYSEQCAKLNFPFQSSSLYYETVGCCNGMLCFYFFSDFEWIFLWNLAIRKYKILPLPINETVPGVIVLGFGACPVTHDPKVVRITYPRDPSRQYNCSPDVEIYAVSRGTWKNTASTIGPHCILEKMCSQAFVNGAVHWIAEHRQMEGGFHCLILSFDMHYEVFHEIVPPHTSAGENVSNSSVAVLRESLAMINYNGTMSCCIWVMKEYGVADSWIKLFTIDLGGALMKIIGFWKNDEIIMSPITTITSRNDKLVSYDPNTRQTKDLDIRTIMRSAFVDAYMETLLSPSGPSRPCWPVLVI